MLNPRLVIRSRVPVFSTLNNSLEDLLKNADLDSSDPDWVPIICLVSKISGDVEAAGVWDTRVFFLSYLLFLIF